ncbi:MAG: GAF domain-containing protein [Alphaproteobacteria bacterium]|nr:GAF domain-containing protein [Alphaproteobacteria bacterium]
MAEATSDLIEPIPAQRVRAPQGHAVSSRGLYRNLLGIELKGTCAATAVMFVLALLGLNFTLAQWGCIMIALPFCLAAFLIPDIWILTRHFRPIGRALDRIDRGGRPTSGEASAAIVQALNLPLFCFTRVNLIHGPLATVSILISFEVMNGGLNAGFALWQKLIFAGTALLFAAPTHALLEYFAIARDVAAPIEVLSQYADDGILPADQARLVAVRLRRKLLYLSIFITGLPLIFFAASVVFKFDHVLWMSDASIPNQALFPLWQWIAGVVLVCLLLVVTSTKFTTDEVSRSAAILVEAMRKVELGNLDTDLSITTTDEYADLFRGFNHMLRGLRDEARLIEITQGLSGELNLDTLIQRIMNAATDLMHAERASLFVYDAGTHELWSRYAGGLGPNEIRIPASAGIAGAVYTSGIAANVGDAYADPRFDREIDHATGYHTRNILCMPIVSKTGARIGVTEVLNKRGGGGFTARDEDQLRAFTAQISVLLENAQLFDEVLSVKNYNENILRSTSNGMITTDLAGRVVTANTAALAILKHEEDAVIGRPSAELFAGSNAWVVESMSRVAAKAEPDISLDASLTAADGRAVSVNMTVEPLTGLNGTTIGSMLVFEDITDEARLKATMRRYMSREVADQLLASGDAALEGKLQTVTILFSDIRNFTGLSEALGARETVALLNEYFNEMVEVVSRHGGILDKYIGDGVMALFGAPFKRPDDADRALSVANEMLVVLEGLNRRRGARGEAPIEIRVGLATGDVIAGNIGSPTRVDYTVIGDSVNLASRLEVANKLYGTRILLDAATRESLKSPTALRQIDLLQVRGKDQPVAVYESLGYLAGAPALDRMIAYFEHGLSAYRNRDWQAATASFEQALALRPEDEPSRIYIDRCRTYAQAPPPDDWGGIWVSEK